MEDKNIENNEELNKTTEEISNTNYVETLVDIEEPIVKEEQEEPKDELIRKDPNLKEGLTTDEVLIRVERGLNNVTDIGSTKTIGKIIVNNVCTFFNFIMFALFIWIISIGSYQDLMFMLVVTLNICIGIYQEIKAKKTVDKLSLLSAPMADVIRDHTTIEIPITELVVDDIFLLEPGKQISADGIIRSGEIEVDESLLTGESDAILKKEGDKLLSGSYVISGTCKAQVTHVGKECYIQKLTYQAKKYKKPKSDLMKSLKILITTIAGFIIPIGIALFYVQYTNNHNYHDSVLGTTGALIGMIPSGLFLLTSISLFVGVIRLGQNNTLVQELYCIENLARINMLCLDKTGTITDGTMTVSSVIEYDSDIQVNTKTIISAMLAILNDKNQTAKALEQKFGIGKKIRYKTALPFASSRKYSAVEFEKYGTFILGAPEIILKENYHLISREVEKYALQGLRVIALATSTSRLTKEGFQGETRPFSLILIEDTIRPEALDTINEFKENGVQIKVISGDNPITVSKVAARAGVDGADKYIDLTGLTEREVQRAADRFVVFGRVTPNQKKILIQSLKKNNVVAMTGDGVNDILALKEADCSIAMASGSEAARNASHITLLDSNFANMPKVVREGRRVINNVQRVAVLFLTKTIFSFLLACISLLNKGTYPITPSQLLLIDFFCIGAPSFFLALEPNNIKVQGKFLWNVLKKALPGALTVVLLSCIIYWLRDTLNINSSNMSTLIVICATWTCLMVLYKVCTPLNNFRKLLFFTMLFIILICVLFGGGFFRFNPFWGTAYTSKGEALPHLPVEQIILLICLIQASPVLINVFSGVIPFLKKQINAILNKITQI